MKKPVGPLGWSAEEVAEFFRARKPPEREVPEPEQQPRGFSLSSLPHPEYMRGYVDGWRAATFSPAKGRKTTLDTHIALAIECLEETDWNEEEARKRFVVRMRVARETASRAFSRALKAIKTLWD